MKNITDGLFGWLNKSAKSYKALAWRKFIGSSLAVIILSIAIIFSVPFSWKWIFWGPVLFFAIGRYFGRYIVSWDGWMFKNATYGFFVCGTDIDRRLKPARQIAIGNYSSLVICRYCVSKVTPRLIEMLVEAEQKRQLDELPAKEIVPKKFPIPDYALDEVESWLRDQQELISL